MEAQVDSFTGFCSACTDTCANCTSGRFNRRFFDRSAGRIELNSGTKNEEVVQLLVLRFSSQTFSHRSEVHLIVQLNGVWRGFLRKYSIPTFFIGVAMHELMLVVSPVSKAPHLGVLFRPLPVPRWQGFFLSRFASINNVDGRLNYASRR